jgi:hypothetical protein
MGKQPYRMILDERLGIPLPELEKDWVDFTAEQREALFAEWEAVRGRIPDRIHALEREINHKQDQLNQEADFEKSCKLNSEISELASTINDLHLWFRAHQEMDLKQHLG